MTAPVLPQNVANGVAAEVRGADDRPTGNVANAGRRTDLRAIHKPNRGVAARVSPKKVVLHVGAAEVALAGDRPRRWHRAGDRGGSYGGAVHEPHSYVAAAIPPRDIALSIAVEVVRRLQNRPAEIPEQRELHDRMMERLGVDRLHDLVGREHRVPMGDGRSGLLRIWCEIRTWVPTVPAVNSPLQDCT